VSGAGGRNPVRTPRPRLLVRLAHEARELVPHLAAMVVAVVLLSVSVWVAQRMGWGSSWSGRAVFAGLVLLVVVGSFGLEAGWRRLRHGPRSPTRPWHAGAGDHPSASTAGGRGRPKDWLYRSTFG
jgi:protein-S-isoprenylcysteine O-methyltransferase Ste14